MKKLIALLRKSFLYKIYHAAKIKRMSEKTVKHPHASIDTPNLYVIRRTEKVGFFSSFFFVLGNMIYATEKGWDFVVDMKNYPTLYNEKSEIFGTKNAWEYYFEQPMNVTLADVKKYKTVIYSNNTFKSDKIPLFCSTKHPRFITPERVASLKPYLEQYIHVRPEIMEECEKLWKEKIAVSDRTVIGVHIRGTDMKATPDHPIPPIVNQYIEVIDKMLQENSNCVFFLCTDEVSTVETLKNRYGEKIISSNAYRSADGKSIHIAKRKPVRENHHYLIGKEVLIDALLLSKCDTLICGHSNVSYAAIALNGNQYQSITLLENENQNKNMTL